VKEISSCFTIFRVWKFFAFVLLLHTKTNRCSLVCHCYFCLASLSLRGRTLTKNIVILNKKLNFGLYDKNNDHE